MSTWQLQTAKAKLSELLRAVRDEGPQVISVRGKEEYVVMRRQGAHASAGPAAKPLTGMDLFRAVQGLGDDLEIPPRGVGEPRALWTDENDQS